MLPGQARLQAVDCVDDAAVYELVFSSIACIKYKYSYTCVTAGQMHKYRLSKRIINLKLAFKVNVHSKLHVSIVLYFLN